MFSLLWIVVIGVYISIIIIWPLVMFLLFSKIRANFRDINRMMETMSANWEAKKEVQNE